MSKTAANQTGVIDVLRNRRSIRKYTRAPVDRAAVELLVEALLRAPTSRNLRPWQFVIVDDGSVLHQLAQAKPHGGNFLENAALAIVVAGDTTKSDVWVEDTSIAGILVQITASSLGLGSCWVQVRNRPHDESTSASAFIQKVLGLPEHIQVASIISIGHPDEVKSPLPREELDFAKVKRNHYSRLLFDEHEK